ncbi:unnamed protein product, partial [marine sediment metagenome]
MSPNASISIAAASVGGVTASGTITRTASGQISHVTDLTAGLSGTMANVSSNLQEGEVHDLESGHDFASDSSGAADRIALFKVDDEADGSLICRYNIAVDTDSVDNVTF